MKDKFIQNDSELSTSPVFFVTSPSELTFTSGQQKSWVRENERRNELAGNIVLIKFFVFKPSAHLRIITSIALAKVQLLVVIQVPYFLFFRELRAKYSLL